MLLTRDNVLRFVKAQKYVTPTHVAKEFDVTTTIASAALSELVKDFSIKLTHIKFGTTPYYYDPSQKECLIEIAEKSFSGNELQLFNKIKEQQIISKNALTIPEQVIVSRLQDVMIELQINVDNKDYTFYMWYLRDKNTTIDQIKQALSPQESLQVTPQNTQDSKKKEKSKPTKPKVQQVKKEEEKIPKKVENTIEKSIEKTEPQRPTNPFQSKNPFENMYRKEQSQIEEKEEKKDIFNQNRVEEISTPDQIDDTKVTSHEDSCDSYLIHHRFIILEKEKHSLGYLYKTKHKVDQFSLRFDCLYVESKKVTLKEILDFYTSSMLPKIIFSKNLPKKLESTIEELENIFIVQLS